MMPLMTMHCMSFSERLQKELSRTGMDQAALARELGDTSASTVGNYVRGKTVPPLDVAVRIAKILDADFNFLATGEPVATSPLTDDERHILANVRILGTKEALRRLLAINDAEPVGGPNVIKSRASRVQSARENPGGAGRSA